MIEEIWKFIDGFDKFYQISNFGRVKSCKRVVNRGTYDATLSEKILIPRKHTHGYLTVCLSIDSQTNYHFIHRLVANAFIEGLSDTVNHKDGDKTNNHVNNLEWMTYADNNNHAIENNLRKINFYNVLDFSGNVVYSGKTIKELVCMGFTQSAISRCLSGKLKSHKNFKFELMDK